MASSSGLPTELYLITQAKLAELEEHKAGFENSKKNILDRVSRTPGTHKRIRVLLKQTEKLLSEQQTSSAVDLLPANIEQLLLQSEYDSSISVSILEGWENLLRHRLNVESQRYQFACLYGLPVSQMGGKDQQAQRLEWEQYVFHPLQTDIVEIENQLRGWFLSTKQSEEAMRVLRDGVRDFEKKLRAPRQIDLETLKWCIKGLIHSDLLTETKRADLKRIKGDEVLMEEYAGFLSRRMTAIDKWSWPTAGIPIQQRRNADGKFRIFHDEDIFDALLLHYVGVEWSVWFHRALTQFSKATIWKTTERLPQATKARREYYLGESARGSNLQEQRQRMFEQIFFLTQLQRSESEIRGNYSDYIDEDVYGATDSPAQLKQTLLQWLSADIIIDTRLHGEMAVIRSDIKSFGPSLPHSTLFAVLKFFGVSARWVSFFKKALEVPVRPAQDDGRQEVLIRKRGTPMSSPMADFLGEILMYCMDVVVNLKTGGSKLYRLHDDFWFWGAESTCATAWKTISDFTALMGLQINEQKSGGQEIYYNGKRTDRTLLDAILPLGDIRWGFLVPDRMGRFVIDDAMVDQQIEELRRHLSSCDSVLAWIQVYNTFVVRYMASMFGKAGNAFGRVHLDSALSTLKRMHQSLFANEKPHLRLKGGFIEGYLKSALQKLLKLDDIPDGYLYFPTILDDLDLRNPFVPLMQARDEVMKNPTNIMDAFFNMEEAKYRQAKKLFLEDRIVKPKNLMYVSDEPDTFMIFEEYTSYREQTSKKLVKVFNRLLKQPEKKTYGMAKSVAIHVETNH